MCIKKHRFSRLLQQEDFYLAFCIEEISSHFDYLCYSSIGISSLSTKLTVTNCIHRYADAILFFLRSGILPESTGETNTLSVIVIHIL